MYNHDPIVVAWYIDTCYCVNVYICTVFSAVRVSQVDYIIGFVEQTYKVVEGERKVTLEVEVKRGVIPAGQYVEVTLTTAEQSANGVLC